MQREDLAVAGIGKEVITVQALALAAIHIAADDGRTDTAPIGEDRIDRGAAGEGPGFERHEAFVHVPAVVRTFLSEIDFLETVLADVRDIEIAKTAVEAVAERVAQAERPDLVRTRRSDERIVGRHRIVAVRIAGKIVAMNIEAEDIAEQVVDVLPGFDRIAAAAAIAERGIEIAVRPEFDPAALVIGQAVGLVDVQQDALARGIGMVQVGGRDPVAADLGVIARIGDVDVEVAVARVVRIEREPIRPPSRSRRSSCRCR